MTNLLYRSRKKTRCSGERPVCAFCARLGQECSYLDDFYPEPGSESHTGPVLEENARLAARVALLESRLSLLDPGSSEGPPLFDLGDSPLQPPDTPEQQRRRDYASLLDSTAIESLTNVYFRRCHQQPYTYFHEASFRQNLKDGVLPSYLLWALTATAVRFSDDPRFADCQAEAINCYSKMAWSSILDQSFSDTHDLNIRTVQAANMLGAVDFVGMVLELPVILPLLIVSSWPYPDRLGEDRISDSFRSNTTDG
jgi:hypothetical protein